MGGGPWPRAPSRAWAPLSPGIKQGCGSHHTLHQHKKSLTKGLLLTHGKISKTYWYPHTAKRTHRPWDRGILITVQSVRPFRHVRCVDMCTSRTRTTIYVLHTTLGAPKLYIWDCALRGTRKRRVAGPCAHATLGGGGAHGNPVRIPTVLSRIAYRSLKRTTEVVDVVLDPPTLIYTEAAGT